MSQTVEKKFVYNGAEYPFNVRNADDAEKYENAIKLLEEEEKTSDKTGSMSAIIRTQCKLFKNFFNRVLEDGAGNAICGEKDDLDVCQDAYLRFLAFVKAQGTKPIKVNAYGVYSNREQRRHPPKPKS